jgi:CRISPR-associated protein Cas5t
MSIVVIEAVAPMASWRPPESQTFHRTLPLPPYTSQVGMLGAALGLGLPDAYRFVADHELRFGVGGWHEGKARDLWKFQKLERAEKGGKDASDIVIREQWIDSRVVLVVEASTTDVAAQVAEGYRWPAYPLTLGASDALLQPLAVRVEDVPAVPTRQLVHAMIYGEISPLYEPFEKLKDIPLTRTVQAPSIENLPTGFFFDSDGGRRSASRALVSFVADAIELDASVPPVVGYRIVPQSKPLLVEYNKWKGLPWTIPVHRYDSTPTPAASSSMTPLPSAKTRTRGKPPKATGGT